MRRNAGGPAVLALLFAAGLILFVAHWSLERDYVVFYDEPLYLLQSRLLLEPAFVRHIDESLSRFFVLSLTIFDEGRFYTQFPPGHPAILAVFDALGLRWWSGVLMSTAGVFFTYLLGRDLHSEFAGRAAAAMLAASQLFVVYGSSYMPHGASIAMGTAAAWVLIRSEHLPVWQQAWARVIAGFLLTSTVVIRPLTGTALAVSILLWQLLRRRPTLPQVAGWIGFLVLGGALPALALLHYNAVTNGASLRFGYSALNGSLHDLGFGPRGFVVPDAIGQWVTIASDFTVGQAGLHLMLVTSDLAARTLPAFILLPLLWVGHRHGHRPRWATIAIFLVLPALHFFYFYSHSRFYLELMPFLFIGVAGVIAGIRRSDRPLARVLVIAILAVELLLTGIDIRHRTIERDHAFWYPAFAAVREAHEAQGRLLVFAPGEEELTNWLSWFNLDAFPGDVIVARDLGADNVQLMRRFPEHRPFRLVRSEDGVRLSPIE